MARQDISYDYEDFGMTHQELREKYGTQGHPEHTPQAWYLAAYNEVDIPPYWVWVAACIKADDDAIPGAGELGKPVPVQEPEQLVRLDNIDVFAAHLVAWHRRTVEQVNHFLSIPQGTPMSVKIGNEPEHNVVLEGEKLQAFRGGVTMALDHFSRLPFAAIPKDQDPLANKALPSAEMPANVGTAANGSTH